MLSDGRRVRDRDRRARRSSARRRRCWRVRARRRFGVEVVEVVHARYPARDQRGQRRRGGTAPARRSSGMRTRMRWFAGCSNGSTSARDHPQGRRRERVVIQPAAPDGGAAVVTRAAADHAGARELDAAAAVAVVARISELVATPRNRWRRARRCARRRLHRAEVRSALEHESTRPTFWSRPASAEPVVPPPTIRVSAPWGSSLMPGESTGPGKLPQAGGDWPAPAFQAFN